MTGSCGSLSVSDVGAASYADILGGVLEPCGPEWAGHSRGGEEDGEAGGTSLVALTSLVRAVFALRSASLGVIRPRSSFCNIWVFSLYLLRRHGKKL